MVRYIMVIVVAAALLVGLSAVGSAQGAFYGLWEETAPELATTPSWYGSTGLVRTPTALICPPQQFQGFAHQIDFANKSQQVYGVNVGLTPTLEVGVSRISNVLVPSPSPSYVSETVVNVKYEANIAGMFNNPESPRMAIGVWDWTNQVNRAAYVVLSQSMDVPGASVSPVQAMNVHIGYGNTNTDSGALDGLFGGLDFIPFAHALAQLEYDGEDFNGVLRYYPISWLSVDAGVVSDELGWGVSFNTNF